jgi:hypothetical protein
MMKDVMIGVTVSAFAAAGLTSAASAQCEGDYYSGGTALVVLVNQFEAPAGANVLGVNFQGLPGVPEQFWPCVNGGTTQVFDPTNFAPTAAITATGQDNGDGTYSLAYTAATLDGSTFVTSATDLTCQTLTGPQEANRFVIDFGNGYQQPGFPVDGFAGGTLATGPVYVDVEYWFARTDGTENREFGDTTGPFIVDEGFVFAWGYTIEDALTFNQCGFIATFRPGSTSNCPECSADLDGNCVVDGADLSILLGSWGDSGGPADINGDGNVDGVDLARVLGDWGDC